MNIKEIILNKARKHRGQIEEKDLLLYSSFSDFELSTLLFSKVAQKRTIAATLLGQRQSDVYVENLCLALQIETSLYPRLAICEALVKIGLLSVEPLSRLIGKIGNNHERELPITYFRKYSYPLARDIAVRTLINIGRVSVDNIINLSTTADEFLLSQLIDALGGLLNKTKDPRITEALKLILNRVKPQSFLEWKIIRAFSAAQNFELGFLIPYLQHSQAAIRWETIRTLGITTYSTSEIVHHLKTFSHDSNAEIRQASEDALFRIGKTQS